MHTKDAHSALRVPTDAWDGRNGAEGLTNERTKNIVQIDQDKQALKRGWKEGTQKNSGHRKKYFCETASPNETETTRTRRHPTTHPYSREYISCVQHCNITDTHDLGTCF